MGFTEIIETSEMAKIWLRCRVEGLDGTFTVDAVRFFIPCIDSGAASHRGAARILGTRNQRGAPESRCGLSAFIRPLRGRPLSLSFPDS
jgi:hypothetical protein